MPGPPLGRGPALETSPDFAQWLADSNIALALTTYQSEKLILLGQRGGQVMGFERTFNRCMGLWSNGQTMWMASSAQVVHLENTLRPGQTHNGYDHLYVPKTLHTTADLDVHELAVDGDNRLVFVNTKFSCLATLSERYSFAPLWRPPFVTREQPEDACHLNGMAMEGGKPRYVTIFARSNTPEGWRESKRDGGCILHVPSGEPVVTGLSMPHSPRVHNGRLWVINSGTGFLGTVDAQAHKFEPVTFCPGYARGMAFVGDLAVVGISQAREKGFRGSALDDELQRRSVQARCGLLVIDLTSGEIRHWATFHNSVTELFDVVTLPGVTMPMALGFKTDDIQKMVFVGDPSTL
jgi:uncharacterized protein (TIGR03032 family)